MKPRCGIQWGLHVQRPIRRKNEKAAEKDYMELDETKDGKILLFDKEKEVVQEEVE